MIKKLFFLINSLNHHYIYLFDLKFFQSSKLLSVKKSQKFKNFMVTPENIIQIIVGN